MNTLSDGTSGTMAGIGREYLLPPPFGGLLNRYTTQNHHNTPAFLQRIALCYLARWLCRVGFGLVVPFLCFGRAHAANKLALATFACLTAPRSPVHTVHDMRCTPHPHLGSSVSSQPAARGITTKLLLENPINSEKCSNFKSISLLYAISCKTLCKHLLSVIFIVWAT